jgi:hypothetical protein
MGSVPTHLGVRDAVIEHARGVLAERFGVDISTADMILGDVAQAQKRTIDELAAAVVASCTNGSTPLPRRLYTHGDEDSEAA